MVSEIEREQMRQCMRALRDGLDGFQTRHAQLEMIAAVAHALGSCRQDDEQTMTGENIAVCECGTGTGKSIAASVPALVMAKSRGKRLVISTSTIALQHQYSEKDIPALKRVLPIPFTFAVAKGRRRYACTAKLFAVLDDLRQTSLALGDAREPEPGDEQAGALPALVRLAGGFEAGIWSGDRDDLSAPIADDLWEQITTDRQGCSGNRCPQFAKCPFYAARQRLKEVDLIIANHDLVLASLQMEGRGVLPDPAETFYVFDEGHSLVAKVVEQFAAKHALRGAIEWVRGLAECVRNIVLGLDLDRDLYRDARSTSKALSGDLEDLFKALDRTGAFEEKSVRRFKDGIIPNWTRTPGANILSRGQQVQRTLSVLREQMFEKSNADPHLFSRLISEMGFFASKIDNLVDTWALMLAEDAPKGAPNARWIERTGDGAEHDYLVCASPISGADKLRRLLWNQASAAVVTSATLASCGSFRPYLVQAGLSVFPSVRTLKVDSPFDYRNKAKLVVPPMRSDPKHANAHTDEIVALLPQLIHSAGTLVLFASGQQMRDVHARLPPALQADTLVQGSMPKMAMLAQHKNVIARGGRSILFGLSSLAEGVDLPGEYCTHVIIAKLPFAVPDSPLEEARSEWVTSLGRSPFVELVLPAASVRLQQAVGRLLRTVEDCGTVTVLDRRLITKQWGALLFKDLPDFKVLVGKRADDAIARFGAPEGQSRKKAALA